VPVFGPGRYLLVYLLIPPVGLFLRRPRLALSRVETAPVIGEVLLCARPEVHDGDGSDLIIWLRPDVGDLIHWLHLRCLLPQPQRQVAEVIRFLHPHP
jgi:hypothetical protein